MKIQNSFIFRIASEYCAFVHRASSMLVKCIYYILFLCEDYSIICGVEHTFFLLQISYIVQFKIIIQLTFLEILASVCGGYFADNQGELLPGGAGLHGYK